MSAVARGRAPERVLPHDLQAERCVLGAILINDQAFKPATDIVGPRDFFRDAHRRIFACMVDLAARNQAIDLVTLKDALHRAGCRHSRSTT